jgi:hypothetical protein
MKVKPLLTRVSMAVLLLTPMLSHASGPDIPEPPTGGVGVLEFLMNLFAAIFAFLQSLLGSLPGIPA